MLQPFIQDGKIDRVALTAELRRFLDLALASARFELAYEIRLRDSVAAEDAVESPEVEVVFRGRDQDLLLERNAELLQALEYIALRWLRLDPHFYDHVRFDSGGYRALRIEELKLSARVAAERVRETRQPFRFNPMSSRERRIIHLVLKEQPGVRTPREGCADERQVIDYPAEKNYKSSLPAPARAGEGSPLRDSLAPQKAWSKIPTLPGELAPFSKSTVRGLGMPLRANHYA